MQTAALRAGIHALCLAAALGSGALARGGDVVGPGCPISPEDNNRAVAAFRKMLPLLQHDRCANCHGKVDPFAKNTTHNVDAKTHKGLTIGEAQRDHWDECALYCHTEAEARGSTWRVPDPESFALWGRLPPVKICERLKQAKLAPLFLQHARSDVLVQLGFEGRRGHQGLHPQPPPLSPAEFVALVGEWMGAMKAVEEWPQAASCGCVEVPLAGAAAPAPAPNTALRSLEERIRALDSLRSQADAEVEEAAAAAAELRELDPLVSRLQESEPMRQLRPHASAPCQEAASLRVDVEARSSEVVRGARVAEEAFAAVQTGVQACSSQAAVKQALQRLQLARSLAKRVDESYAHMQTSARRLEEIASLAGRGAELRSELGAALGEIAQQIDARRPFVERAQAAAARAADLGQELGASCDELQRELDSAAGPAHGRTAAAADSLSRARGDLAALRASSARARGAAGEAARGRDALARAEHLLADARPLAREPAGAGADCPNAGAPASAVTEAEIAMASLGLGGMGEGFEDQARTCLARLERMRSAEDDPAFQDLLQDAEHNVKDRASAQRGQRAMIGQQQEAAQHADSGPSLGQTLRDPREGETPASDDLGTRLANALQQIAEANQKHEETHQQIERDWQAGHDALEAQRPVPASAPEPGAGSAGPTPAAADPDAGLMPHDPGSAGVHWFLLRFSFQIEGLPGRNQSGTSLEFVPWDGQSAAEALESGRRYLRTSRCPPGDDRGREGSFCTEHGWRSLRGPAVDCRADLVGGPYRDDTDASDAAAAQTKALCPP